MDTFLIRGKVKKSVYDSEDTFCGKINTSHSIIIYGFIVTFIHGNLCLIWDTSLKPLIGTQQLMVVIVTIRIYLQGNLDKARLVIMSRKNYAKSTRQYFLGVI